MTLYRHPKNERTPPSNLSSTMLKHPDTEIDIATAFNMTFPKIPAIAHCESFLSPLRPARADQWRYRQFRVDDGSIEGHQDCRISRVDYPSTPSSFHALSRIDAS